MVASGSEYCMLWRSAYCISSFYSFTECYIRIAVEEALHRASSAVPASPARIVLSTSADVSRVESSEMVEVLQHGLNFPLLPPVQQGVLTRGFEPVIAHYAIDIAAEEGSPVHAVGEGYVVFADWTQEGGYVIAVQHQGGYLTVYKHNRELLKQIGERVKEGEIIALRLYKLAG